MAIQLKFTLLPTSTTQIKYGYSSTVAAAANATSTSIEAATHLRYLDLIHPDHHQHGGGGGGGGDDSNVLLKMVLEKLQATPFRYYIYDNPNITRHDIRIRAKNGQFTWRQRWGQRFKEFSLWEIRYLEAFEEQQQQHQTSPSPSPSLRTLNASEADFIIIPIPWCALMMAGMPNDLQNTMNALYHDPLFLNLQNRFVVLSFMEYLFQRPMGLSKADYNILKQVSLSVALTSDATIMNRIPDWVLNKGYWSQPEQGILYQRGFSISWMGAATDDDYHPSPSSLATNHQPMSPELFLWNKTLHFFYQTTTHTSLNNSTQFRHGIVHQSHQTVVEREGHPTNQTLLVLPQPSSIGWGLRPEEWLHDFASARFCLVIRGDNPASRSLWRAIRHGCIPVVVSDMLPYYSPVFRSLLDMDDYAVMVDEFAYLANPTKALTEAIYNLTLHDIQSKLNGVNLMQRLIIPNHPKSLFVQAFGRETLFSFSDDYYKIQKTLYGVEFNTSY